MNELNICPNCCNCSLENGVCPSCGYKNGDEVNSPHTLPIGTILRDRYFIGKVLGEGGFGITYMGYDITLKLKVAIKEYYPAGFANREHIVEPTGATHTVYPYKGEKGAVFSRGYKRFLKEATRLSKFAGEQGVVTVRDLFEENSTAYIVMEFIEGDSLKTVLAQCNTISEESTLLMLIPVIETLAKMHKDGVIHRDIAPDNIMLDRSGKAHLIDFGSAIDESSDATSTMALMKRGFAAEEMQDPDHTRQGPWTDVYSICATIYNAIEGKVPADVYTRRRDAVALEFTAPVSKTTKKAIMHGLALEANERTQSMDELIYELGSKTAPIFKHIGKQTDDNSESFFTKNKRFIMPAAAACVAVAVIGTAIGLRLAKPVPTVTDETESSVSTTTTIVTTTPPETIETTTSETTTESTTTSEALPAVTEGEDITDFFPDDNFKAAIREELGLEDNAPIYREAVEAVTELDVWESNISDLTGIEYFTALGALSCENNELTSLPELPSSLQYLYCGQNKLTSLPELPHGIIQLFCEDNRLTSLPELPDNLTHLSCYENQITSLPALPNTIISLYIHNLPGLDINEVVFKDGKTALEKVEEGVILLVY
jgi:serine/threonine protein kinase